MRSNRRISTNDVFKLYAKKGAKLTIGRLDGATILVEGDRTALEFLGNLILTYARSDEHNIQISPTGAGKNRFSRRSTLGLYLHRVPCTE